MGDNGDALRGLKAVVTAAVAVAGSKREAFKQEHEAWCELLRVIVELVRPVDNALRKPRLSHGRLTQATTFGENSAPLMTTA